MGSKSRRKGRRGELEVVNLHTEVHVPARRRQAPGLPDAPDDPDVLVAELLSAEVKRRKSAAGCWGQVREWLQGHDLLFMREDGADWLVVMPVEWYKAFLACWYGDGAPTDFIPKEAEQ